ncbi:MAG: hypothetical protein IJ030_02935 [Oscillospiraceae bacterium]|nr:hypothetical protein [Oscillospiraceae bacterium]
MWYGLVFILFLLCEFLASSSEFRLVAADIHGYATDFTQRRHRIIILIVIILLLALCLEPMGWAPLWNGEVPGHRDQYEKITQSFLKGHLYFDVEVDPALLALENPYDRDARTAAGVEYRQWNDMWDHAYYNGHYYMYFGVVPVLLVFMPYQLLTGQPLTTYHATQIFAALFIVGLFLLFAYLTRKFFPKMPLCTYLLLTSSVAVMSIWYCVAYPALYCTAIISALCLMIWSLYFFIRAVFDQDITWKTWLFATLGSLCGALVFGCRPTIALGNLLVLPLLVTFFHRRKLTGKQWCCTALCALPYVAVAAGLMWYNNARFDNPFEFGQSYQMTVADQSQYGNVLARIEWKPLLENIKKALFRSDCGPLDYGIFVSFPILLLSVVGAVRKGSRKYLFQSGLGLVIPVSLITVVVIIAMGILWTPYLLPRYTMDYIWLMGLALFVSVGALYQREKVNPRLTLIVGLLSVAAIVVCVCLFLTPYDANYASHKKLNLAWVNGILKWK